MIYCLILGPLENRAWGKTNLPTLYLGGAIPGSKSKGKREMNPEKREIKHSVLHYQAGHNYTTKHSWVLVSQETIWEHCIPEQFTGRRGERWRSTCLPASSHLLFLIGQSSPQGARTPPYFPVVTWPSGQLLDMPKPMSAEGASSEWVIEQERASKNQEHSLPAHLQPHRLYGQTSTCHGG